MPPRQKIPIKLLVKSALNQLGKGTNGEITRLIMKYYPHVPVGSVSTNIRIMKQQNILLSDLTIRNHAIYSLRVPVRNPINFII